MSDFNARNGLIVNNNILVVNSGGWVAINSSSSNVGLLVAANDAIQIPVGNTGQRPSVNNVIRFNTDTQQVEYNISKNGATTWNNFSVALNCGRLYISGQQSNTSVMSNSSLIFLPFNGDRIRINGGVYQIPSTGITANVANCFLNGVGNSALTAVTTYYAYTFVNTDGSIAIDFSATGHTTSTTSGNVGTEIKTGDDTRTLIGMIQMSNGIVAYNANTNCLINWFNRRDLSTYAAVINGAGSGILPNTTAWGILLSVNTLLWRDELPCFIQGYGQFYVGAHNPDLINLNISISPGATTPNWITIQNATYSPASVFWTSLNVTGMSDYNLGEGFNTFNLVWNMNYVGPPNIQYQAALSAVSSG